MGRRSSEDQRPAAVTAAGEFALIVVRLWPLYVAAAVLGAVIELVEGDGLDRAVRAAARVATFGVLMAPLGWVPSTEGAGGLRRQALLFLVAVVWIAILFAPAIWILGWADP